MSFGLIVVGDETLSGKRQDKHLARVIELHGARGLALAWARFVGDDRARIVQVLRDAFAGGDASSVAAASARHRTTTRARPRRRRSARRSNCIRRRAR